MANLSSTDRPGTLFLEQIHEGMKVFDQDQKEVGKVKSVYFGAAADQAEERGQGPATNAGSGLEAYPNDSLAHSLAGAFARSDELPDVLRSRLLYNGFIRIDSSGWFARDTYAMPEQIESVAEDKVFLNVALDELVKE